MLVVDGLEVVDVDEENHPARGCLGRGGNPLGPRAAAGNACQVILVRTALQLAHPLLRCRRVLRAARRRIHEIVEGLDVDPQGAERLHEQAGAHPLARQDSRRLVGRLHAAHHATNTRGVVVVTDGCDDRLGQTPGLGQGRPCGSVVDAEAVPLALGTSNAARGPVQGGGDARLAEDHREDHLADVVKEAGKVRGVVVMAGPPRQCSRQPSDRHRVGVQLRPQAGPDGGVPLEQPICGRLHGDVSKAGASDDRQGLRDRGGSRHSPALRGVRRSQQVGAQSASSLSTAATMLADRSREPPRAR